jgi:CMP-2-keto-3-deoxyoctulosonic acid synthetase
MIKISESEADNPNNVKVVVDKNNFAMYFSRSKIPYNRDSVECSLFKHIGVYGFKKKSLLDFAKLPPSKLEVVEKIEAIRILENGFKLKMIETDFLGIGIDTVEDLIFARTKWLNK